MSAYKNVSHTFQPIYDQHSKVLILGTLPSVKSRENCFYYGNPQNRFWKVIAALTDWELPDTIEKKKEMLLANNIAIWDVIASCDIVGSSDSSIRDVVPNNFTTILKESKIENIFANGGKAYELYMRYVYPKTDREILKLPSTSPANAACNLEKLCEEWKGIVI